MNLLSRFWTPKNERQLKGGSWKAESGREKIRRKNPQKTTKIGKTRGGLESQFPFAADDGTSSLSFYHRLLSFRLRFYHDSGEVQ